MKKKMAATSTIRKIFLMTMCIMLAVSLSACQIFDSCKKDKKLTETFEPVMDEYNLLYDQVAKQNMQKHRYGPGSYGDIPFKVSPKIALFDGENIRRYDSISRKTFADSPDEVRTIIFLNWNNSRHNATWTDGRKEYISDCDFYLYDLENSQVIGCIQIRNRSDPLSDFISALKTMLK